MGICLLPTEVNYKEAGKVTGVDLEEPPNIFNQQTVRKSRAQMLVVRSPPLVLVLLICNVLINDPYFFCYVFMPLAGCKESFHSGTDEMI